MTNTVEWRPNTENSRSRQVALYAVLGGFGGFLLAILLGGLTIVALSIQRGNFGLPVLVILFVLIGGPLSLLYLWPMLTDPEQRPPLPAEYGSWRPDYRLLGVAIVATTLLASAIAVFSPYGVLVVVASWSALLIGLSLTGTTGRIDPGNDVISVGGQRGTLSAVTGVRRLDILGLSSIFVLGYQTATAGAPRLVIVPGSVADNAHEVFRWAATQEGPDSASGSTVGRLPFFVTAGCCLLVAVGLWHVGVRYTESAFTLAPGIGLFAILGLLFAWFGFEQ